MVSISAPLEGLNLGETAAHQICGALLDGAQVVRCPCPLFDTQLADLTPAPDVRV